MLTHVKHCKSLYTRGQQGLYDSQQRMDEMQSRNETLDMQHRLDLSYRVAESISVQTLQSNVMGGLSR